MKLPISDFKNYYAENVPPLLERSNLFLPAFLEKLAAEFLASGKCAKFSQADLRPGVSLQQAGLVLNRCMRIVAARYNNSVQIKNARSSGARSISLELERHCTCRRAPKNKRYKINADVPLFPCLDCDQEELCIVWYKINF